jgi:hypothetical protein
MTTGRKSYSAREIRCRRPGAKPLIRIEIDYRPDPAARWLPTGWKTTVWNARHVLSKTCTVRVANCEINPSIDDNHFDLVFPAGTRVIDSVRQTEFVVLDDGSERVLTHDDLAKVRPVREILEESRKAGPIRRVPAPAIFAALALLFAALALYFKFGCRSERKLNS